MKTNIRTDMSFVCTCVCFCALVYFFDFMYIKVMHRARIFRGKKWTLKIMLLLSPLTFRCGHNCVHHACVRGVYLS